jgi:hypothetical protein
MIRRNISVLFVVLMAALVAVGVPQASAKQYRPANTLYNDNANQIWTGTASGMATNFFIDNPPLQPGEVWSRFIDFSNQDLTAYGDIGIEKCGSASNNCYPCKPWSDGRADLFLFITFRGGSDENGTRNCYLFSPTDSNINTSSYFAAYLSQDGQSMELVDTPTHPNNGGPLDTCLGTSTTGGCSEYSDFLQDGAVWHNQGLHEQIYAGMGPPNELVYGGTFAFNQWRSGDFFNGWQYQLKPNSNPGCGLGSSPCPASVGNPVQMYWQYGNYPNQYGSGGRMTSCVYAPNYNGNNCIYRG